LIDSPFAKRDRNEGLLMAVRKGHTPIVELLLEKANVDATVNNNEAIRLASTNGNVDIVRMLLSHPEVDPGDMDNEALFEATRKGYIDVVRLLLAHPNVKNSARSNRAVLLASDLNHSDIVKLFVNIRRRANPTPVYSEIDSFILERAAQFGNVDLVRFLISRISFNRIVQLIFYTGNLVSIRTLVEAGVKIDQDTLEIILRRARLRRNVDIIEYLESLKEKPKLPAQPLVVMTEQCAICLSDENLLKGYMTSCNHQFHAECLQQWIAKHNTCPMCRSSIL
jgi:hypothetical protein